MLTSNTMLLRTVPMRACGFQLVLLRSTTCQSSSFNGSLFSQSFSPRAFPSGQSKKSPTSTRIASARSFVTATKPSTARTVLHHSRSRLPATKTSISRRSASTSSSAAEQDVAAAEAAAAASAAAARAAHEPALDWNTFFVLRKQRRRLQLAFSAVGCLGGGTLGALYLSTGQADWLVNQVPLDPLVTLGLMTFGCAALGWLLGPSAGSAIFYTIRRKYKAQMMTKESQFFSRIKKHRVDPSSSSAGNPVPDFYGEKIQSVAGYRQWLKDQRAYNKKRMQFV